MRNRYGRCGRCGREQAASGLRRCPANGKTLCLYCCMKCRQSYWAGSLQGCKACDERRTHETGTSDDV